MRLVLLSRKPSLIFSSVMYKNAKGDKRNIALLFPMSMATNTCPKQNNLITKKVSSLAHLDHQT